MADSGVAETPQEAFFNYQVYAEKDRGAATEEVSEHWIGGDVAGFLRAYANRHSANSENYTEYFAPGKGFRFHDQAYDVDYGGLQTDENGRGDWCCVSEAEK